MKHEEFINKVNKIWNSEYHVNDEYKALDKCINVTHLLCGKIFTILADNLLRQKIPCPYCNPNSHKNTDIYTYQLNNKFNDEYLVIGEYSGALNPIHIRHKYCGTDFNPNAAALLRGVEKCPLCSVASNKMDTNIYKKRIYQIYEDEYSVVGEYTGALNAITIRHNICGFEYNPIAGDFSKGDSKCPICNKYSKMHTYETMSYKINQLYSGKFIVCNNFSRNGNMMDLLCTECNEIMSVNKWVALRGGIRCRNCCDGFSYPEKFVICLLRQLEARYIFQLSKRDFKWINNYRYDFYLNDYNCIIEVNGEQHYKDAWQSLEYQNENDEVKMQLALSNNISNYIIIDARQSNMDYLKTNIINSDISNYFDLSIVDWEECNYFAYSSMKKQSIELYNSGMSILDISQRFKLHPETIKRYIKEQKHLKHSA